MLNGWVNGEEWSAEKIGGPPRGEKYLIARPSMFGPERGVRGVVQETNRSEVGH